MDSDTYETRMRVLDHSYDRLRTDLSRRLHRVIALAVRGDDVDLDAERANYWAQLAGLDRAKLSAERALEEQYFSTMMGVTA